MIRPYVVKFLRPAKVRQAYPLVQNVTGLSLAQWQRYADTLVSSDTTATSDSTGIVSVEDPGGYIYGLFGYRIEMDLRCGRVLHCENLLALDLLDRKEVVAALMDAMESLARDKACQAVHVRVARFGRPAHEDGHALAGRLHERGHVLEATEYCKPLRKRGAANNKGRGRKVVLEAARAHRQGRQ